MRVRLRENLLSNYSKDIHPVKSHKDKIQVRLRESLLSNYSKDIHPVKSHKDKI